MKQFFPRKIPNNNRNESFINRLRNGAFISNRDEATKNVNDRSTY